MPGVIGKRERREVLAQGPLTDLLVQAETFKKIITITPRQHTPHTQLAQRTAKTQKMVACNATHAARDPHAERSILAIILERSLQRDESRSRRGSNCPRD